MSEGISDFRGLVIEKSSGGIFTSRAARCVTLMACINRVNYKKDYNGGGKTLLLA